MWRSKTSLYELVSQRWCQTHTFVRGAKQHVQSCMWDFWRIKMYFCSYSFQHTSSIHPHLTHWLGPQFLSLRSIRSVRNKLYGPSTNCTDPPSLRTVISFTDRTNCVDRKATCPSKNISRDKSVDNDMQFTDRKLFPMNCQEFYGPYQLYKPLQRGYIGQPSLPNAWFVLQVSECTPRV